MTCLECLKYSPERVIDIIVAFRSSRLSLLSYLTTYIPGKMTNYTSAEEFEKIYSTLNATFKSGKTKDLRWRKWQLKQLWWMLEENEGRINIALQKDLNRHDFESYFTDLAGCKHDVLEHIKNLEKWTKDEPIAGAGFIFGTISETSNMIFPNGGLVDISRQSKDTQGAPRISFCHWRLELPVPPLASASYCRCSCRMHSAHETFRAGDGVPKAAFDTGSQVLGY
jgi:hypothetical protein